MSMGLSFLIYDMMIGRECMQGAWDTTARAPDVTVHIWSGKSGHQVS